MPAATDSPADPVVCTMLFCRIVAGFAPNDFEMYLKIVIERTEIGIDALTVSPTLSARYTLESAKTRPRSTPSTMAPGVSSAMSLPGETYGTCSPSSAAIGIWSASALIRGCVGIDMCSSSNDGGNMAEWHRMGEDARGE